MIRFNIKIDDKEIYKKLKHQYASAEVGFFEGEKYEDGTPVAAVAAHNEFGGGKTPPRPFMSTCMRNRRNVWRKVVQNNLAKEVDARKTLAALCEQMVLDISDYIRIWTSPPNAPATIKKKGFNDPLVDTGRMMRSVDWRGDWL